MAQEKERHVEGELYKKIELYGRTFNLYYGYYEDCDRINPLCEPIPIYPDFTKEPVYTDRGEPFATEIQDACLYYKGNAKPAPDITCADCQYLLHGEGWFGICLHRLRQRKTE